jgi:hypothetical protein
MSMNSKTFTRCFGIPGLLLCFFLLIPESAAAFNPPDKPILFQPMFIWRTGAPTHQGTGFFAKAPDGRVAAITSSHFLDMHGPALLEARWLDIRTQAPVATFKLSWGPPGAGSTDTPTLDLRRDYLLLPVQDRVPGDQVLELDPRAQPEVRERIWFPNKDKTAPLGYRVVTGTVVAADLKSISVMLDQPITLASQSGSPIISQATGRVIGTLSRGGRERDRTLLILAPASALLEALTKNDFPPLHHVIGR